MYISYLKSYMFANALKYYLSGTHTCVSGYALETSFGSNHICGTMTFGSAGEKNLGGPGWPTPESTQEESEQACADACKTRTGCTHYIWFNNLGCRTQTSCSTAVAGDPGFTSFICKKGGTHLFIFTITAQLRI